MPEMTAVSIPTSTSADTRLSGRPLVVARYGWVLLMLFYSALYVLAVLVYSFQFHGYQEGIYAQLMSSPGEVSGYDSITSLYLLFTGPYTTLALTLISPCWFAVSLLIFWRRPDDWMALFVSLFLVMLATNLSPAFPALTHIVGYSSPLGICITLLHLLTWSSIAFFFALFPDGRFVPGWTRWLTLTYLAWQVAFCLPSSAPFSIVNWPPLLVATLFLSLIGAFCWAQLYRYRHVSSQVQRQQTKWIVFGMLLGTFVDAANLLPLLVFPALTRASVAHSFYASLSDVILPLVSLFVPGTIGLAVLRYRLWDIDLLINRTLVYGLLTTSTLALYLLVVVGLGEIFSALGNLFLSLFATGLVAVLFQPLRQRLQQAVNRLMFGERDDPNRLLSRLGSRLEDTLSADALLPTIVQSVAQALKLPYVAITYRQPGKEVLATYAGIHHPQDKLIHIPLVAQGEQVGEFLLTARGPGDHLTSPDLRLLHGLAPQMAVAIKSVLLTAELKQLTGDLQQSRARLITSREEERRRLRRDLHDGLGPTLASLTFKIDAARNLLKQEPARADQLLEGVRQQTQETLDQIRRLVYILRPPALDELGLLGALREQAAIYQYQGLRVVIDAPEKIAPLPAAVEVAAYRIAREAITNVVRHAAAQQCYVRLNLRDGTLALEISDDGKGLPDDHRTGVGLLAMQERAVELGGSCIIKAGDSGGTTIQVSLPLEVPADSSPSVL